MVDMGSINLFGSAVSVLGNVINWILMAVIAAVILGVFFMAYHYFSFPIKLTYWQMYGSGKDGVFSVGKEKTNRLKWINKKTAWRKLWPLFNREELEPFSTEYMYIGNKVYGFELENKLVPGRINIIQSEEKIRAEINPVPYYIRNWQSLQHKKNAQEFAEHTFWSDNKAMIIGLVVAGMCLAMALFTIWFSYKYAQGTLTETKDALRSLSSAIRDMADIPGAPG